MNTNIENDHIVTFVHSPNNKVSLGLFRRQILNQAASFLERLSIPKRHAMQHNTCTRTPCKPIFTHCFRLAHPCQPFHSPLIHPFLYRAHVHAKILRLHPPESPPTPDY